MVHFSCDICGKIIHAENDERHVVKIESHIAQDSADITEADLDEDHMEAISQMLRDIDDPDEIEDAHKHFRFDLCSDCHKKFISDPLGKEHSQKLSFSKN